MQGKSATCKKKVCSKGMNRCLAMTVKATSGGQTMNLWMRQCSDNHFCSLDDVTACALTQQNLGGAYSLSECNKACSSSKDARMPAFLSSSGSKFFLYFMVPSYGTGPSVFEYCSVFTSKLRTCPLSDGPWFHLSSTTLL